MGLLEEPRYIIKNVCNNFYEMPRNTIREQTFCCGSGAGLGDQRRVMKPADAVAAGADILVVGRPITRAPDPVEAARVERLVREDPDVMLLGEMRDRETFYTAIQASETGHLVFGTIHASTAPSTIGRIARSGMPAFKQVFVGASEELDQPVVAATAAEGLLLPLGARAVR